MEIHQSSGEETNITLETNGVLNGDQTLLNLVQGTNMTITDDGMGNVTFDSSGSGSSFWSRDTTTNDEPFLYPTNNGDGVHLNSVSATPDNDQLAITANGLGALSFLNWGPGDQEIHGDVLWRNGGYLAKNTTVNSMWMLDSGFQFYSNSGQVIDTPADLGPARFLIKPTGALQAPSYGSGTFTGTPTYTLQVDATGNIIEGMVASGGTVTSVDVSGGTTGLTTSGGPITTSGTVTLAGTLNIANGGTGQTTAITAFDALSPLTTLGDTLYNDGSHDVRLPGNITTTQKFLSQTGDGSISAAPSWQTIPSAGLATYFLYNTASDISTYFQQKFSASTGGVQTQTFIALSSGTTTLSNFATNSGFPDITFLPPGVTTFYITARKSTGTKTVQLFGELYQRTSGGTETLLSTTALTIPLSGVDAAYIFQGAIPTGIIFLATDRIVSRFRAVVSGGGSAPTVVLSMEDNTSARTEIPASSVDVTNFVPYTGALFDVDLNSKNLTTTGTSTAGQIIDSGLTANTVPYANDSKQLTSSAVTPTELGYVSGVTSSIQTQLNGKQPTGNYITALTGDVTAAGPGSVAATLATVNSNVGTFGSASKTVTETVNAKGLITAVSEQNIQITESQVTNLTTDLAGKVPTTRTITINGTTQDLSADRTYNVGTVTSIATSTGLTGGTITGTGTIQLDTKLAPADSLTGNALKVLRVNAGETAVEYATPTTGTVTSIATAGLISGGTITSTGTITSSMATNKLVGRGTAGTGVFEEITLGTGLSLSGTTLNVSGGSGSPASPDQSYQFNNNTVFGGTSCMTRTDFQTEYVHAPDVITVPDASSGVTINFNYGSGSFVANGYYYNIELYQYRTIDGVNYYSNGYKFGGDTDDGSTNNYNVDIVLPAFTDPSITGYRLLIQSNFYGWVYDHHLDTTTTTTINDDGTGSIWIAGNSVFPTNYLPQAGRFLSSDGNARVDLAANGMAICATGCRNYIGGDICGGGSFTQPTFIFDQTNRNFEVGSNVNNCGCGNIIFGDSAGACQTGSCNILMGCYAGCANIGCGNTYLGTCSGYGAFGNNNFASGSFAMQNSCGSNNFAFGNTAGANACSGANGNFIAGQCAGTSIQGCSNIFLGDFSGICSTGSCNFAAGGQSGQCVIGASNFLTGCLSGFCMSGCCNISLGSGAGQCSTGCSNFMAGANSAGCCIVGSCNIVLGSNAGVSSNSSCSVMIGDNAGCCSTSGTYCNVFIGNTAGGCHMGCSDFILGYNSGFCSNGSCNFTFGNNTGNCFANNPQNNFFIGNNSGCQNQGSQNSYFIGDSSGSCSCGHCNYSLGCCNGCCISSSACSNYMIGEGAGNCAQGCFNTMIGCGAGLCSSGFDNYMIGKEAGQCSCGSCNVSYGYQAALENTGSQGTFMGTAAGGGSSGNSNSAIGNAAYVNSNGSFNFAAGGFFTAACASGDDNIFLGTCSGFCNSGSCNLIEGYCAGICNSGFNNIILGKLAGICNTGNENTIIGECAGCCHIGTYNFIGGWGAGCGVNSQCNTILGYQAGSNTTCSGSTILGFQADSVGACGTAIGYCARNCVSDGFILGDSNVLVGIRTSSPTHPLDVNGDGRIVGAFFDSSDDPGTSGYILSSTNTGTDWIPPGGGIGPAGSGTELQYRVNGTTFGAVTGSSVSGSDINVPGVVQATTVQAGLAGTQGTFLLYPSTASKGSTQFRTSDNSGNTQTTVLVAPQAGTRAYSFADVGASADVVMTEGAQTINTGAGGSGSKTFTETTSGVTYTAVITAASKAAYFTSTGTNSPTTYLATATEALSATSNSISVKLADGTYAVNSLNGDIVTTTAGFGFGIKSGSNARIGTSTLVGGTVTISNTSVTANTVITLSPGRGTLTNLGIYTESARVNGTSITITSVNPLDVSTFDWILTEKL